MGVFRNRKRQIRSGWKIILVIMVYVLLQGIISFGAISVIGYIISASQRANMSPQELNIYINHFVRNSAWIQIVTQAADFVSLMLVIYAALRLLDKKRFTDIGLTIISRHSTYLLYGLILGAASMTFIFFTLLLTGDITLENRLLDPRFTLLTAIGLIVFIFVGIKEEALTRGYCINVLNQMGKPWLSVVLSSVIFSALHFFNPNVKPLGLVNILLVGILFGYMYLKTGSLWMPIGYHITWNYFQGDIFGLPVSGGAQKGIYTVKAFNDNLLTGGSFGPEAGVLVTAAIIIGMILVWKLPKVGLPANKSEYRM